MRIEEKFDTAIAKRVLGSGALSRSQYHELATYLSLGEGKGCVGVNYTSSTTGIGRFSSRVVGCKKGDNVIHYTTMKREIRSWLAHRYYHDIDIANCQPVLMHQMMELEGIATPCLKEYIEGREDKLNEVMESFDVSRDIAKNIFIILCNSGRVERWLDEHELGHDRPMPGFVVKFEEEMHKCIEAFLSKKGESVKDGKNGSRFSQYYFTQERLCLEALVKAVKGSRRKVGALIYDGVHVERVMGMDTIPEEMLRDWEGVILEETGITVSLVEKEMELNPLFVGESVERSMVEKDTDPLPLTEGFVHTLEDIKGVLETMVGFRNVTIKKKDELGFSFDADKSCPCPLCAVRVHETDHWYILTVCPRLFAVRSYSSQCKQRLIGFESHKEINEILMFHDTDQPYVALFQKIYGDVIIWTGKRFMFFEDHRWKAITQEKVYSTISAVAKGVMQRLLDVLSRKKLDMEHEPPSLELEAEKKKVEEFYNNTLKGLKYVNRHSNLHHFFAMARNFLIVEESDQRFDMNPWLLGVDNGIIEINEETGEWCFRDGKPEDMVSKSVGYSFDEKEAKKYRGEVEEMFEKIYPHEDEREVVQRYFGYSLLGYHPQKQMLLLTDARGGYNGKSTVCKAIRAVLGQEYSVKPLANFLYQSDRVGNIESHASGTLSYKGLRLAVVEELNPSQRLDSQFLKDCNGGRTTFRGRVIRSDEHIEFEWTAKFILAFNGGNMPRFDVSDRALQMRMLVVQHRSRFHLSEEEYEKESHLPYTYKANTNLDAKINGRWRSALLSWCLDGLKNYVAKEFRVVPAVCREWVDRLAAEQDLVAEFVRTRLERTGDKKDFVSRADLYATYKSETSEERDKKMRIGKTKFFERVVGILGEQTYRELWPPGVGPKVRGAFIEWRIVNEGVDEGFS